MIPGQRVAALADELEREHQEFVLALEAVPNPEGRKVVETWDARDLVIHVAFWSDHAAKALALATTGRGAQFDYDSSQTDAMNAQVAAGGHSTSLLDARAREATAYEQFRGALMALDDGILDLQLGNGDSVEDVVRYDGPDHYAEHSAHLRAATR